MSPVIDICPVEELPPGEHRLVEWEDLEIGVFNCDGEHLAIEDRCSHDDGSLLEGEVDPETCTVECPRHGSVFDLRTGKPAESSRVRPRRHLPGVGRGRRDPTGGRLTYGDA